MKKIKVVFHVMATGSYYETNGQLHHELETKARVKINFVSFSGMFLGGDTLKRFLLECKDAEIVIVDAWNHPLNKNYDSYDWTDPEGSIAEIVKEVIKINPLAKIFADLMEGKHKVAVHEVAEPIKHWTDKEIIEAIKCAQGRSSNYLNNLKGGMRK